MILLSMVIMNLSVAAVIEGLAEASKENTGIVSGDDIDILIEKWKDYDINASGLISYKDLIFLLYEVPPPLGLGHFTSYYSQNTAYGPSNIEENEEKKDDIKNINNLGLQDKYMIRTDKQIYIKKSDAIKIFNDYAIPLYGQNVHFKDVAKALIEKIFKKNKLSYDLTEKINKRLKKQWEGKYAALKKYKDDENNVDTGIMEARNAILNYYRRNKEKNKGKQYSRSIFKSTMTQSMNKNNQKLNDSKMFNEARIDNYLKNGETEEVKNDHDYNVFRELIDENLKLNQENPNYIERSKYKNENLKFSWFQNPEEFNDDNSSNQESESAEL